MAYVSMEEKFRVLSEDNNQLIASNLEYKTKVAEYVNQENAAIKKWVEANDHNFRSLLNCISQINIWFDLLFFSRQKQKKIRDDLRGRGNLPFGNQGAL